MTKSENALQAYWQAIQELLDSEDSQIDFRLFSNVSERFLTEYQQLQRQGLPGQTVALAMLYATMNMYALVGSQQLLPQVLRVLADKLDQDGTAH